MPDPDGDAVMRGFLYQKALIARYGVKGATDLNVLATRLVDRGDFQHVERPSQPSRNKQGAR